MKKDIFIATKALFGGALDWEVLLGPYSAFFIVLMQYCFGPMDFLLNLLLWVFVVDYLTGYLKARHLKQLSSRRGSTGFLRKIGKLLIVILAVQIGKFLGSSWIRIIIMGGYITNEMLSIIENGEACGLIPKNVAKSLLQYQKKLSSLLDVKEGDQ